MAEYIEREAALLEIEEWADTFCECDYVWPHVIESITNLPAVDVRPVVTCGKCKYGKNTGTEWFCDKHSGHADKFGEDASYHEYHSEHWFCADGEERKHE